MAGAWAIAGAGTSSSQRLAAAYKPAPAAKTAAPVKKAEKSLPEIVFVGLQDRLYEVPLAPGNYRGLNMDGMNNFGDTRDITVIGLGMSDLDDYLEAQTFQGGDAWPAA